MNLISASIDMDTSTGDVGIGIGDIGDIDQMVPPRQSQRKRARRNMETSDGSQSSVQQPQTLDTGDIGIGSTDAGDVDALNSDSNLPPLPRVHVDVHVDVAKSNIFEYLPDKDPNKAVIKIDGKDIKLPVHETTISKQNGVTPRFRANPEFHARQKPTKIDPEIPVHLLTFPRSNEIAGMVYAYKDSNCPLLRNLYEVYGTDKLDLKSSLKDTKKSYLHVDDMAGGNYLAAGYATIPPGPKCCPKSERMVQFEEGGITHKRPYIRRTIVEPSVQKWTKIAARATGAAAAVVKKYFPDMYEENNRRAEGAEDVCFPPRCLQENGSGDGCFWHINQCIYRCIGADAPFGLEKAKLDLIAFHTDDSDDAGKQILQFWPIGGAKGNGGNLENTDICIFEKKTGGRCFQAPTNVEDCVVLCVMDGSKSLHGGSGEVDDDEIDYESSEADNGSTRACSLRLVTYFRGPITEFVDDRKKHGGLPKAFIDLKRDCEHWPLDREDLFTGAMVSTVKGKIQKQKKNTLTIAEVKMCYDESGDFRLQWDPKWQSDVWTRNVYSVDCALGKCTCAETGDFKSILI